MVTATATREELLLAIDETVSEMVSLTSSLGDSQLNEIPYKDSWTAGQLLRHVTKSTNGMSMAMNKESETAGRDPAEKVPRLKNAFLDFSNKMQSPEFIIPEEGTYDKEASIEEITKSFNHFKESANKANLNDMVTGLPLGDVTKLEILHFVLYHTQRHLHQLQKIYDALKMKE